MNCRIEMTPERMREAIVIYRAWLEARKIPVVQQEEGELAPHLPIHRLAHCHWVLYKVAALIERGEGERAARWMRAVQVFFIDYGLIIATEEP